MSSVSSPRQSRYAVIASAIAADIESGRYPVGETLPAEAELMKQFGVSRHTVREALRELKARGLLSSHSGIGTRVRASSGDQRFIHGVSTIQDLLQVVEATYLQVTDTRELIADEAWAALLRCACGQHWTEVRTLRMVRGDSVPIALVCAYIPPVYSAVVEDIEASTQPIFSMIEQRYGVRVVEIRQEVTAVTLDEAQAAMLQSCVGASALKIVRHHLDAQDKVAQASIGIYPTERSSYVTSFRVQRGLAPGGV
ncbi:GntR family transcriptional regulator [Achromobacter aloeverae]|uniref:GntR family transcriptional regulator n=1 Tax=Achromobacter aloeverae TaxID=1750518 RepID=A0A4Q1HP76_9BURK|nr:GntR family transcriptional regulator [Achromobacter aloeverae]RXN92471.1 GntR family transcriptional regulator [Achromobacter aloeverae]